MAMTLLPPAPDVCHCCAVDHDPEQPHNKDSLYYQYWFYAQHGRWPTWRDAMEHCSFEVRAIWATALLQRGVDLDKP